MSKIKIGLFCTQLATQCIPGVLQARYHQINDQGVYLQTNVLRGGISGMYMYWKYSACDVLQEGPSSYSICIPVVQLNSTLQAISGWGVNRGFSVCQISKIFGVFLWSHDLLFCRALSEAMRTCLIRAKQETTVLPCDLLC